jgi:hypothetical protein
MGADQGEGAQVTRPRRRTIRCELYKYDVHVLTCSEYVPAYLEGCRLLGLRPRPDAAEEDARGTTFGGAGKSHCVWFPNRRPSESTVAHEACHSVIFVMTELQMNCPVRNDEAWAYLLGWTVEQIRKALR